ncbi:MAG: FGGY-family carbohydrate kinase [Rhizobiaceae bacterium]
MTEAVLAIDIGTGSARAGLVGINGEILALQSVAHDTRYPHHGWVEQAPEIWWRGACEAIYAVAQQSKIDGISIIAAVSCGQTHAPVLLDEGGKLLTPYVSLWNDKRAEAQVHHFRQRPDYDELHALTGNPAAPSWPAFKLAWYSENEPEILSATHVVLMPKDFINYRLTGECAADRTEAGYSYLYESNTEQWSDRLCRKFDLPRRILPELRNPDDVVGYVSAAAAEVTGLPTGLPVVVGAGDYPAAVLGSGVFSAGQVSDITGTSSLMSLVTQRPLVDENIMNAASAADGWLAFTILDAAGDSVRWGRRQLEDNAIDLATLTERAGKIDPGADGLLFLPYLTGERIGHGPSSRGAFVGLTADHDKSHMHRAITEGIAMGMRSAVEPLFSKGGKPEFIISAGGGAYSRLLLEIKASVFRIPYVPVVQVECGLLGGASLVFSALGRFSTVGAAAKHLAKYHEPIRPDPVLADRYEALYEVFSEVRNALRAANNQLSLFAAQTSNS